MTEKDSHIITKYRYFRYSMLLIFKRTFIKVENFKNVSKWISSEFTKIRIFLLLLSVHYMFCDSTLISTIFKFSSPREVPASLLPGPLSEEGALRRTASSRIEDCVPYTLLGLTAFAFNFQDFPAPNSPLALLHS